MSTYLFCGKVYLLIKNRDIRKWILCFLLSNITFLPLDAQQGMDTFLSTSSSKEACTKVSGMFTTYRLGEKIYWEIPDSLFGRDIVVTITLLEASALKDRSDNRRFGYAGDLFGPLVICFQNAGNQILLQGPLTDRHGIDPPKGGIHSIAAQRSDWMVYETLPVLAKGSASVLIEATDLLMKNSLFTLTPYAPELTIGLEEFSKSSIEEINGFPGNLLIRSKRSYIVTNNQENNSFYREYTTSWKIETCLALLPKEPLQIRIRNPKVGYFSFSKTDFSQEDLELHAIPIVKRWRLEPKDTAAYFRGELVEPKKPIVYYIDRNTPSYLVPHFIEAVNVWQEAFERIGFKNAIRGELAPSLEENPDFSEGDIRHSFISWKTSPVRNAYGTPIIDPRSGEIIAARVGVFSSTLDLIQQWYFAQCGCVDADIRKTEIPNELLGSLLQLVITHEVGHTLGLEHNFLGSSRFSIDQLRDSEHLDQYGITTSIMDYVRFNYALRSSDSVSRKNRIAKIGAYDYFAIDWGYRYAPNRTNEELNQWVEKEQQDSLKLFSDGLDVRAQAEDLGNDPIETNQCGIQHLKQLMNMPELWRATDKRSYQVIKSRYQGMVRQHKQCIEQVLNYIGGHFVNSENGQTCISPVPKEYMRKVMKFVETDVLSPCHWLFQDSLKTLIHEDIEHLKETYYHSVVVSLIDKLIAIAHQGNGFSKETYSLKEYISELHRIIFGHWQKRQKAMKDICFIQSVYVEELQKLILTKENDIPAEVLIESLKEIERICQEGEIYLNQTQGYEKQHITGLLNNLNVLRNN